MRIPHGLALTPTFRAALLRRTCLSKIHHLRVRTKRDAANSATLCQHALAKKVGSKSPEEEDFLIKDCTKELRSVLSKEKEDVGKGPVY